MNPKVIWERVETVSLEKADSLTNLESEYLVRVAASAPQSMHHGSWTGPIHGRKVGFRTWIFGAFIGDYHHKGFGKCSERHGHKCGAHLNYSKSNTVITSDERLRYREIFLPPNVDPIKWVFKSRISSYLHDSSD